MFTYKKAPYKFFALDPKFCWAGPVWIPFSMTILMELFIVNVKVQSLLCRAHTRKYKNLLLNRILPLKISS